MKFEPLTPEYDAAIAALIRTSLKAYHLDIPGTAYYDEALDHLSVFYNQPSRAYYVLLDEGKAIGGIGLAGFDGFPDCCELQKLYLDASRRGRRLGYGMIEFIEGKAREMGYRRIYLETHSNLRAAIHIYERCGYREIARPETVVHSTMDRFYLHELQDRTGFSGTDTDS